MLAHRASFILSLILFCAPALGMLYMNATELTKVWISQDEELPAILATGSPSLPWLRSRLAALMEYSYPLMPEVDRPKIRLKIFAKYSQGRGINRYADLVLGGDKKAIIMFGEKRESHQRIEDYCGAIQYHYQNAIHPIMKTLRDNHYDRYAIAVASLQDISSMLRTSYPTGDDRIDLTPVYLMSQDPGCAGIEHRAILSRDGRQMAVMSWKVQT